ncbi:MAG: amidohydrolase [Clostridiales Family XIII bacterium]|jgi:5-methylthioadenosine/S-adenosylhomocysteine deaminase|nr:amidohydrolase [Clostridiales Family XIII bacterium]
MSTLFERITILDKYGVVQPDHYVLVKGSRIAYVGKESPGDFADTTVSGRDKLLMPAFYNAHSHSVMSLLRGYGENMVLDDWLNKRIFPFEAQLDKEAAYWGAMLHMAESFRNGIASSTDMYNFCEEIVRAAADTGAKINMGRALLNFDEDVAMRDMDGFKEMDSMVKIAHGAYDGRIRVEASLHAEYTSTERLARELAEYAATEGLHMHVHVSETKAEHEGCKERRGGRTPVRYLYDVGLFDVMTTAAHCVWIEREDVALLKEKDVTVATCPVSNIKLASGLCPVPSLLRLGVNVALGTDSVASNNNLDMIEEMKFMSLLQKGWRGDPTLLSPREAVNAATFAGAAAQGRSDCGSLSEGYRADLIVLDMHKPEMQPVHDVYNNLVYAASGRDVYMTMIDGKVVYKDGAYLTLDIDRVLYEAAAATKRILGKLDE